MISRGVVKVVNDSLKCQGLQVALLSDELQDDVERFQEYGFTSTPFTDAEALFLSVGGNRAHGIVVCVTDRRYRPKDLNAGDVCLYTDKGERVYLDRVNDIVHIGAKSGAEFIAQAAKTLSRLQDMVDAYKVHKHPTGTGPSGIPDTLPTDPVVSVAATKGKVT